MVVCLDEVIDGEIVLAVVETGAAPDDLLELDHRIDGPHEHDVADVPGIHAGGQFLGRRQDRGRGLLVVLEIAQVLFAQGAVVGRHPLAIVRVFAGLHLVDQIAHRQRMVLCGAEYQRLLLLVNLGHEDFHALPFPGHDLDNLVEVRFRIALPHLDLPFHQHVVRGIHVLIEGRGYLLHPERRQEPVVDALLEGIDIHRVAEIAVGVGVFLALRCGGQPQLHRRGEVFEDVPPVALVVGAAPVAFVHHDEVEEVFCVFAEVIGGTGGFERANLGIGVPAWSPGRANLRMGVPAWSFGRADLGMDVPAWSSDGQSGDWRSRKRVNCKRRSGRW